MSRIARQLSQELRFRWPLRRRFIPQMNLHHQVGPFLIRTAQTTEDLQAIFRLRALSAAQPLLSAAQPVLRAAQPLAARTRLDEEDWQSDHILIFHTSQRKLVGTVRVRSSFFGHAPILSREFHLHSFLTLPGEKIEVARLRFHPEYQRPMIANLMWRALADVMSLTKAQYIYGSVSLMLPNPRKAALLYHYFNERGWFRQRMFCPPQKAFSMSNLDLWIFSIKSPLTEAESNEAKSLLSPLLESYLRAGAFLGGEPAWDSTAQCVDFLTILHRDDLNRALWKKFDLNFEPPIA